MKISVALCTYNGEKYLKEQIDSIVNQTHKVDEVIVCDDNSTDNTKNIIDKYKFKFPNIFKIIKNKENVGTIQNFENAILLTTGDLIFLSDQDDVWKPNKVEIMLSFFRKNRSCLLLFTNGDLIDKGGNQLKTTLWEKWEFDETKRLNWQNNNYAFFELINNYNKITGATICFHKKLKKCLPIKYYPLYFHDAYLGLNASAINGLRFINESLIYYRIHNLQQVGVQKKLNYYSFTNQNSNFISKEEFIQFILKKYRNKFFNYYIKILLKKIKKFKQKII